MEEQLRDAEIDFARYSRSVRRLWWIPVLLGVVGVVLAGQIKSSSGPAAVVRLAAVDVADPVRENSSLSLIGLDKRVRELRAETLRHEIAERLEAPFSVSIEAKDGKVITIAVRSERIADARQAADAYHDTLVAGRRTELAGLLNPRIDSLARQEQALRDQMAAVRNELGATPADQATLGRQVALTQAAIKSAADRDILIATRDENTAWLTSLFRGVTTARGSATGVVFRLMGGLLMGAFLGLFGVTAFHLADGRIRSKQDLERMLGAGSVLAVVPRPTAGSGDVGTGLALRRIVEITTPGTCRIVAVGDDAVALVRQLEITLEGVGEKSEVVAVGPTLEDAAKFLALGGSPFVLVTNPPAQASTLLLAPSAATTVLAVPVGSQGSALHEFTDRLRACGAVPGGAFLLKA